MLEHNLLSYDVHMFYFPLTGHLYRIRAERVDVSWPKVLLAYII